MKTDAEIAGRMTLECSRLVVKLALRYWHTMPEVRAQMDVEDLISECMLEAFRALRYYDPSRGAPTTLIHTAVSQMCRRKQATLLRPKFHGELTDLQAAAAYIGRWDPAFGEIEARDAVEKLLESVSDSARLLLLACFGEHLPGIKRRSRKVKELKRRCRSLGITYDILKTYAGCCGR